ncbi:MAG: UDP-N-acetylglucosamine--N-acetylmuramyl-(pentapeptide) pyrophosphoryl-undecaprenol N-acetylglucosamine transferase [Pseudomonadota bacterium]
MKVLITGGGSGGHVTPALAVASELAGCELLFVGSNSGLEERIVQPSGLRYRGISAGKLRRYFSWHNVVDVLRVLLGILQALVLIGRERPAVVFSKGGFVAFPVVFAAWLWRVPVVAHESDATLGLANRLSLPFVKTLCVSFAQTQPARFAGRLVHTGAPLRGELLAGDAQAGRRRLGMEPGTRLLLVTGGSLGAEALNAATRAASSLLDGWHLLLICGAGKRADAAPDAGMTELEYVAEGWADLLAAADVVVSRAGSNALFELLALRKPTLLVPLPSAGSRGDQLDNAAYAERQGYARVLQQADLNARRLADEVNRIADDAPELRERLATFELPNSAALIAAEIKGLAGV